MALKLLRINNLRNIQSIEFEPTAGINVLWGANGAGKTSVLEAIYLLGRGTSFRSEKAGPVIRRGASAMDVFGKLEGSSGIKQSIGIRKKGAETELRANGEGVKRLSLLTKICPVIVVTPRSHEIIERGPENRRRFLDWGVFHVEPMFHRAAMNYRRVLRQRNAALRKNPREASIWDRELVRNGMEIEGFRQRYLEMFEPLFASEIGRFLGEREVLINYRPSSCSEQDFLERLKQLREEEIKRGHTLIGPHRTDLLLKLDGRKAGETASRGEQKLIIAALFLAQARFVGEKGQQSPIFLIDDLPAELDREKRACFLGALKELGVQVFITGTEMEAFQHMAEQKMFHVEQGRIG